MISHIYRRKFIKIRPKILYTLTFRLPPEVFIRRMKYHFFIWFLAQ